MPTLVLFVLSYNRADYIGETIESLIAQTFQDFRLIVLDNGSTDCTKDVVARYPSVEYLSLPENVGFYPNFLRIKEIASAEWVMAFHDDDLLHPAY